MKKLLLILLINFISLSVSAQTSLNAVWMNGFGGPIGNDKIHHSFVDASGNIYITGVIQNSLDIDPGPPFASVTVNSNQAYFSKFSPNGTMLWSRNFNGESVAYSEASAITVDASGNVYVAGFFASGIIDFNLASPGTNTLASNTDAKDMFIVKYSSSGAFISMQAIGNSSANVTPIRMKFDGAGDLIVSGHLYQDPTAIVNFNPAGPSYTVATNGNTDGFVAKYNSAGVCQFAIAFGGTQNDYCYGMDVDALNNVYVTGIFRGIANFGPMASTYTIAALGTEAMAVAKYSSTGALVWAHGIGGSLAEGGFRLKVDNNSDIIATGYMTSSTLDADPSPTITLNLTKVGTGPTDVLITKFNAAGNLIWAKNTGGTGEMWPYNITNDAQNNIYLVGAFEGVNDFDFNAAVNTKTAITSPGQDAYLAKYTSTGNYIYAYAFGGGGSAYNEAYEVQIASNNDVLFGGIFIDGSVDFDPSAAATNTLPYNGGQDVFYCRYSQCITPDTPTLTVNTTTMCANSVATLSIASGNLNSATNWVWASVVCGSGTVGVGTTVTVSPLFLTEYFVRGEGGCSAPGACATVSVDVAALKGITGTVTTGAAIPVPGLIQLFRYEGALTKWDSVTYQNVNASGIYSFNAVNSGSYIIMAIPTATDMVKTYAPNNATWKNSTVFSHGCLVDYNININVVPITTLVPGPGVLAGKIVEGVNYGGKGTIVSPGNPISGLTIKGGKNPGGGIVAQGRTNSAGQYTISGLPISGPGESYFIFVDIPGVDTAGTHHKAITTSTTMYTDLDFLVDSDYVRPIDYTPIKELNLDGELVKVYPNPAKDLVYIKLDSKNESNITLELYDVFGKKVIEQNVNAVQGEFKMGMDVAKLNRGIYFVRIRLNTGEARIKLILTE